MKTKRDWLAALKVGDTVYVSAGFVGNGPAVITAATARYVKVWGFRWRRTDGRVVGAKANSPSHISPIDMEVSE